MIVATYTFAPRRWPFVTVAASIPWARVRVNSEEPLASIDQFGLSDMFVQPIWLGWNRKNWDFATGYGFYAPIGEYKQLGSTQP